MKKWYNFETMFRSLKDGLRAFLLENDIYFEISATGFFCGWHFEIQASAAEAEKINKWIDSNTIYCEGVH